MSLHPTREQVEYVARAICEEDHDGEISLVELESAWSAYSGAAYAAIMAVKAMPDHKHSKSGGDDA